MAGRGRENDTVTTPILKWLNSLPRCRALKIHGGIYQSRDVDIIGCYAGSFFAIECKRAPGMHATRRQQRSLDQWEMAGGAVGVCTSLEEARAFIQSIDPGLAGIAVKPPGG